MRLASINAVEVHSRQTSTDLNATQKHANGLRLPSINISTVCPNQASTNLCAPNSHTQDGGARYNDYKCVVNVGRVANGEWLTVELTPDLSEAPRPPHSKPPQSGRSTLVPARPSTEHARDNGLCETLFGVDRIANRFALVFLSKNIAL